MSLRPTQGSTFDLVQRGLRQNLSRLVRAQEQVSSGKRILRPSDDPSGASLVLALKRQASRVEGWRGALGDARPVLSQAASRLQEGSDLVGEARALVLQAMNGTLSQGDRDAIATQLEELASGMLDVANSRYGDRFLFGGTATGTRPFSAEGTGSDRHVAYAGNSERPSAEVGREQRVETGLPGDEVFGGTEYERTRYGGLTGVARGRDADSGAGYANLRLRTDAVAGTPPGGIAVLPGATILGDHALEVDAAENTVRLGSGPAVEIPVPPPASLTVTDQDGSKVELDLSAWNGTGGTATLTGTGSVSLDGVNWKAFDGTEDNLQLQDAGRGQVLHVDLTGATRAGEETVVFEGATNLMDTLHGLAHDLRNGQDLTTPQLTERLGLRLEQLDAGHQDLLLGLGQLGARMARLDRAESQLSDQALQVESLRSDVEDADLAQVVLDMTRSEQTLQVAQATGVRLLQQTLLDYLR